MTACCGRGGMPSTYGIYEHGQAAKGSDGVREVGLGKVQLADVAADLLHHDLAGLRLAPNLPNLAKQFLDRHLGCCEILPETLTLWETHPRRQI